MIRIGIIGSIGSGKSFIAKLFKFPVFNADNEVKSIYKNSRGCFNKLKKKIPKYIKSFPVKKSELITAIIKDKNNLIKISSVVHPLVRKKLKIFVKKYKKSEMVVLDIPLLIENKLNNKDDILIFVKSNKTTYVIKVSLACSDCPSVSCCVNLICSFLLHSRTWISCSFIWCDFNLIVSDSI